MKLSGSNSSGRHLPKNVGNELSKIDAGANDLSVRETGLDPYANAIDIPFVDVNESEGGGSYRRSGKNKKRPKNIFVKALVGLAVLAVAAITVVALDLFADTGIIVGPPPVNQVPRPGGNRPENNPGDSTKPVVPPGQLDVDDPAGGLRNQNKYTFLILGLDEEEYNTDVIMTVTFDTENHTLNAVSIPRDTLVNVEWSLKLANSILANMRIKFKAETDRDKREELAMQATVERFADILGYETDNWITVNMKGFAALIDAIGGVDFNVPVNMEYHDPYQNLHISYSRGMHTGLTGKQALEILRFRSYASADIGRINTQQLFLTAAVEQILAKKSSINMTSLAGIVKNHIKTDIPLNHLIWFGLRFLEMEAKNVSFAQVPANNMDFVGRQGYVTIYIDEWLEMLNERLNPFSNDKTPEDLSILTRGPDRKLYVTDGNWAGDPNWGSSSRGPNPNPSTGSGGGSGNSTSSGNSGAPGNSGGSGASGNSGSSDSSGDEADEENDEESDGELPPDGAEPSPGSETDEYPPDESPFEGLDRQQPDTLTEPLPQDNSPPASSGDQPDDE